MLVAKDVGGAIIKIFNNSKDIESYRKNMVKIIESKENDQFAPFVLTNDQSILYFGHSSGMVVIDLEHLEIIAWFNCDN